MKISPTTETNPAQSKPRKKWVLPVVIVAIVLVSGLIGGAIGFWRGAIYGQKRAGTEAIRAVADIANPLNLLSNNPIFPNTFVGKVTDQSKTGITVKLANGETKKVIFDTNTQVTKGNSILTTNDLKKDASVTVLAKAKDNDKKTLVATRIIIR